MPHDADTITFGFEASIRTANSLGANPPKTTEWIAPSRAQASMAMTASGIIGMYRMTRSPRATPLRRSTPAKRATRSRNSLYVKDCRLSVTGLT